MSEITFVNGMIAKRKDNAPDFVICSISLKVEELIQFMQQHNNNGWVNVDIKKSRGDKLYASLNDWKPNGQTQGQVNQGFGQPTNNNGQATNNGGQSTYDGNQDIPF